MRIWPLPSFSCSSPSIGGKRPIDSTCFEDELLEEPRDFERERQVGGVFAIFNYSDETSLPAPRLGVRPIALCA